MRYLILATALLLPPLAALANPTAVDPLLAEYQSQGATKPDAGRGQQLWNSPQASAKPGEQRSCADCHTSQLRDRGKHVRTGKPIEPLAPAVNSKSLSDPRNVKKWLMRNCKWTLGRECSAQEKADLLVFIRQQ